MMKRDFEVIAVMLRRGYALVSMKSTGGKADLDINDPSIQIKVPVDTAVRQGDLYTLSLEKQEPVAVVEQETEEATDIEDQPQVDIEA
jgi:acetolactate synthase regulatory subunit